MYHDWPTLTCVDVVDMRRLVHKRFGWDYKKANPFTYVRKTMAKSRWPFDKDDMFPRRRCTAGCGKTRQVADRYFSEYAICQPCVVQKYRARTYYDMLRFDFMLFDVNFIEDMFQVYLKRFQENLRRIHLIVDKVWFSNRAKGPLLKRDGKLWIHKTEVLEQYQKAVILQAKQNCVIIKQYASNKGLDCEITDNYISITKDGAHLKIFQMFAFVGLGLLRDSEECKQWLDNYESNKRRKTLE